MHEDRKDFAVSMAGDTRALPLTFVSQMWRLRCVSCRASALPLSALTPRHEWKEGYGFFGTLNLPLLLLLYV